MSLRCEGEHDLFIVECIGVEEEGKVVVIAICRHCGTINFHEKVIARPHAPLRLLHEEKEKLNVPV